MKKYDALFIFPASLKDEALDEALASVGRDIEKLGGKTLETDRIGVRSFARRIRKKETGCYVRMTIEMDAAKVAALRARLKLNESVIRAQIVVWSERPVRAVDTRAQTDDDRRPDPRDRERRDY